METSMHISQVEEATCQSQEARCKAHCFMDLFTMFTKAINQERESHLQLYNLTSSCRPGIDKVLHNSDNTGYEVADTRGQKGAPRTVTGLSLKAGKKLAHQEGAWG